jgi:hypothetical protein
MNGTFAQKPLPVSVVIEPEKQSKTIAYAPVAPKSAGEKPMVMIAMMFRLTNHGSKPLHFHKAIFTFPGPPFIAEVLYKKEDVLGNAPSNVTIDPGKTKTLHFSRLVTIKFSAPAPSSVSMKIFFEESDLAVVLTRFLEPHVCPVEGGAYRLPFKASDLPSQGIYGGNSGHRGSDQRYGYDSGAARWDSEKNEWRSLKPGETENTNENQVDWGLPVYAMADGEVLSFANDVADNPEPPEKITGGGGNHFVIRHGTDRVLYAHFKQGSLNPDLLQKGSQVMRGQFLGRIGNSGSSTSAHLHIHAVRLADKVFQPILFSGGYVVERALLKDGKLTGPWTKLDGHVLPFVKTFIWAAPFLPVVVTRFGMSRNQVATNAFQVAAVHSEHVLTAIRDNSGRMRVMSWSVPASDKRILSFGEGSGETGAVDLFQLFPLEFGLVCTAITSKESRQLKLIIWRLSQDRRELSRLGDSHDQAGISTELDCVSLGAGQVATIVRTEEGCRKIILWRISPDGGSVERLGNTQGDELESDLVSIASAGLDRLVSALRQGNGRLLVEIWEISDNGAGVKRKSRSDISKEEVSEIRLASMNPAQVVTVVRADNNLLKLITWAIARDGSVHRTGDSGDQAEEVRAIAVTKPENEVLVTAVITKNRRLKIIAWHVSREGDITRLGDSGEQAGIVSLVRCTALSSDRLVSVERTGFGRLRLTSWKLKSIQDRMPISQFNFDLKEAVIKVVEDDEEDVDIFESISPESLPLT